MKSMAATVAIMLVVLAVLASSFALAGAIHDNEVGLVQEQQEEASADAAVEGDQGDGLTAGPASESGDTSAQQETTSTSRVQDPSPAVEGFPIGRPIDWPDSLVGRFWPAYVFTDSLEVWELARENGPVKDPPGRGSFLAFLPEATLQAIEQSEDVRAVARVGVFPYGRPPASYGFPHVKRYWVAMVSTTSESALRLIAEQALAEPGFGPPDTESGEEGFVAWLPETLLPVLEADPEVRLAWNSAKLPLGTIL